MAVLRSGDLTVAIARRRRRHANRRAGDDRRRRCVAAWDLATADPDITRGTPSLTWGTLHREAGGQDAKPSFAPAGSHSRSRPPDSRRSSAAIALGAASFTHRGTAWLGRHANASVPAQHSGWNHHARYAEPGMGYLAASTRPASARTRPFCTLARTASRRCIHLVAGGKKSCSSGAKGARVARDLPLEGIPGAVSCRNGCIDRLSSGKNSCVRAARCDS